MNKKLKEKIREAFASVSPVTIIVLALSILIVPMPIGTIVMFMVGALLLIVGMGFFSLGADMSMMPMGEGMGVELTKARTLWAVVGVTFIMGFIITVAEPDLSVLADQVPAISNATLILTVAVGVGIFLVAAILRILYKIRLAHMLLAFYGLIFLGTLIAPRAFIAVAFDSGGVTTGPITVPFIMALGLGVASVRSDKDAQDDSFGLVALGSVGPIMAVLILGAIFNPSEANYTKVTLPPVETMRDVARQFAVELPIYAKDVLLAVIPIMAFFAVFQLVSRRYKKRHLSKIGVGFAYTFIGLVLFLTGVNVGFIPVGHMIGSDLAASSAQWLLVPVGMIIGYFIVDAEPAVHVLNKQVEEVSGGAIPQKAMRLCLSIGMATALGVSMLRVLTGINIMWVLIPGYAVALGLTFVVPRIFTGIAFDSGGVASGPMTSTFLLPFAMGACEAAGGDVLTDAFGIVALVAMAPLIVIQIMGLAYRIKMQKAEKQEEVFDPAENEMLEFYDEDDGEGEDGGEGIAPPKALEAAPDAASEAASVAAPDPVPVMAPGMVLEAVSETVSKEETERAQDAPCSAADGSADASAITFEEESSHA